MAVVLMPAQGGADAITVSTPTWSSLQQQYQSAQAQAAQQAAANATTTNGVSNYDSLYAGYLDSLVTSLVNNLQVQYGGVTTFMGNALDMYQKGLYPNSIGPQPTNTEAMLKTIQNGLIALLNNANSPGVTPVGGNAPTVSPLLWIALGIGALVVVFVVYEFYKKHH